MNAFTPPVPPIPMEHRSPISSADGDVFSFSSRGISSKPLPPIVHSPSTTRDGEDFDDKSIVFVDKVAPLPPLPPSSPATPARIDTAPSGSSTKRRSMSVSDADVRLVLPKPVMSAAAVPVTPDKRRQDRPPPTHAHRSSILDVFKGELSTLDSISLDLRDPSTPNRQSNFQAKKTDSNVYSPREAQGDRSEILSSKEPAFTDPFGGQPVANDDEEDAATPSAIIPPRTSSLASPARYSLGSITPHTPGPRPANASPFRSRSGPPTSAMAALQHSPRDGQRLRVLHRSTGSSSEPSLIPAPDDIRTREFQ